ncbi:phosphotransferase family protein [Sporolactobacillus sp. STCC-11]|uniref:aminoglycoside phosphotransferase family protein n=1 Tax=Sporolactobacillus caesalpiniae TaxID=3230362 RepID=UPI00339AC725
MRTRFLGIPGSDQWKNVKLIDAGWSHDQKYAFESSNLSRYLLRVSDSTHYVRRKKEYEAMKQLDHLDIKMSRPVDFGICDSGKKVYTIMTWVDGEEAAKVLPALSFKEQYALGYQAGRLLKQIHSISAPAEQQSWSQFYQEKIDRKLADYRACGIVVDHADLIIHFIETHRYLIKDRPMTFQHGDYHCGNMVISGGKKIGIIDFDRLDYGDPWEEFNRITWCAGVSCAFASGRINGYFEDRVVPAHFFELMALYSATNMISSIPWSISYGQHEINVMIKELDKNLDAYDHYRTVIPKWYMNGM